MEKGIQIALRYLENKLTMLINRGVLIKLTQSQNNYSNLHFYCSTLVFNIYFFEFAKLLGGPGPPRPLPTLRHCKHSPCVSNVLAKLLVVSATMLVKRWPKH